MNTLQLSRLYEYFCAYSRRTLRDAGKPAILRLRTSGPENCRHQKRSAFFLQERPVKCAQADTSLSSPIVHSRCHCTSTCLFEPRSDTCVATHQSMSFIVTKGVPVCVCLCTHMRSCVHFVCFCVPLCARNERINNILLVRASWLEALLGAFKETT